MLNGKGARLILILIMIATAECQVSAVIPIDMFGHHLHTAEMAMQRLIDLSKEDQKNFFDSFDTVFCDVDGVLWTLGKDAIAGASDGIEVLRSVGKKIYFVTNNSTAPMDIYLKTMRPFKAKKEEIVRPSTSLIWYLKKIKFDKEIYVLGFQALKDELKNAGFSVVSEEPRLMEETSAAIVKRLSERRPNVGAVILDFVINTDYMGLQMCIEYITKNNAEFLVGSWDPEIPYQGTKLIASMKLARLIEDVTGVSAKILGKPGEEFKKTLEDNIGPYDPRRVLFIGDSADTDMTFARNCGFQKLLPLSGFLKEKDLHDWKYDADIRPDYVVENISEFSAIVSKIGLRPQQ